MLNVNQITSRLAMMPDQALKQYAEMHKDDPYTVSLAISESNRRKEIRAGGQQAQQQPKVVDADIAQMDERQAPQQMSRLPEQQGIGTLPAPNMQGMAGGGIVAFKDEGQVKAAPSFDTALDMEGVRDPIRRAFLKAIYSKETESGANTTTSNRGAVGQMQILPGTFKGVASPGMKISNPLDNMRAGIRYASQGYQLAGGDPKLAAAYYYGGPNGLNKAKEGIAVSDPKNPNYPTTFAYANDVSQRMAKLKPITGQVAAAPGGNSIISSANAGELPQATRLTPQDSLSQNEQMVPAAEADRSLSGQLKRIYEGMGSVGERIAPKEQLYSPSGQPVADDRGFFTRAGQRIGGALGVPESTTNEAMRQMEALLNVTTPGVSAVSRLPKAMGTLSAAEQAAAIARAAKNAQADEAAAAAVAKTANLRLLPPATTTRGGVAALSEEDKIRRGLATPVPVPPKPTVGLEALSDAEKAKRGLTPQGTQFPLSPEAIEMNRRLAAARAAQKTAPIIEETGAAGKTYPLGAEAVEMNQKLAAAKNAQALRNMKADEQAAANAAKLAEETKLGTKAEEGLEAINATQKANRLNQVIRPANAIVDAARLENAAEQIGENVSLGNGTTSEQPAPVSAPDYQPPNTRGNPAPEPAYVPDYQPPNSRGLPAPPPEEPSSPQEIIKMAKEETPKSAATKGFTSDDWLNLGFNLLAGKSQYAMENIGTAGIATLAAKREREKEERTAALTEAIHTPEAERVINRLMQEKGLDYAAALEFYYKNKNYIDTRMYGYDRTATARENAAQTGATAKTDTANIVAGSKENSLVEQRRKDFSEASSKFDKDNAMLALTNPGQFNSKKQQEVYSTYPEFKNQQNAASAGVKLLGVRDK